MPTLMERYFRYTPSRRVALLKKMVNRRLVGVTRYYRSAEVLDRHPGDLESFLSQSEGILTLALEHGLCVDFTRFGALCSMLVRVAREHEFKWGEYGLMVNPAGLELADKALRTSHLQTFLGQQIVAIQVLRLDPEKWSYQGQACDVGVQLSFAAGEKLIITYQLTEATYHLALITRDQIVADLRPFLIELDLQTFKSPDPLPIATKDPFQPEIQAALHKGEGILSSKIVDYDVFKYRILDLDPTSFLNQKSKNELEQIKTYLEKNKISITDLQFYIRSDGSLSIAEPVDVELNVDPEIDRMIIDALIDKCVFQRS